MDAKDVLLKRLIWKAEVGYPPFQDRPGSPWREVRHTWQIPNELREGRW